MSSSAIYTSLSISPIALKLSMAIFMDWSVDDKDWRSDVELSDRLDGLSMEQFAEWNNGLSEGFVAGLLEIGSLTEMLNAEKSEGWMSVWFE